MALKSTIIKYISIVWQYNKPFTLINYDSNNFVARVVNYDRRLIEEKGLSADEWRKNILRHNQIFSFRTRQKNQRNVHEEKRGFGRCSIFSESIFWTKWSLPWVVHLRSQSHYSRTVKRPSRRRSPTSYWWPTRQTSKSGRGNRLSVNQVSAMRCVENRVCRPVARIWGRGQSQTGIWI